MPRAKLIIDPNSTYHISSKTRNNDWYDLPAEIVWDLMSRHLYFVSYAFKLEILSFVMMNNHYHLICRAPHGNLSQAMQRFLKETSLEIQKLSRRRHQIWSGRFFRSRLNTYYYEINCYKYVYQNPLRAGIVKYVEDYPYSTLHGLLGRSQHLIPTPLENILVNGDTSKELSWLNNRIDKRSEEDIRYGLRFSNFRARKRNQRQNPIENSLV